MYKSLVVLAIFSMMSAPAAAQTAPAANPAQPSAKPQMVKKRVCQMIEDDDPYSRLGSRKICKTIEVPAEAPPNGSQTGQTAPATANRTGNHL